MTEVYGCISGTLTNAPEEGTTQSKGTRYAKLLLGIIGRKDPKSQEKYPPTVGWARVTVYNQATIDFLLKNATKGTHIIAHGRMQFSAYANKKDGNPQVSIDMTSDTVQVIKSGNGNGHSQGNSSPSADPNEF